MWTLMTWAQFDFANANIYWNWPQFYAHTHTTSIDCDRMPMPDILSLIDSFVFARSVQRVCERVCALGLWRYWHISIDGHHMPVLCVNIMARFSLDTSSKWRTQIPSWLRWKHDSSHGNVSPVLHAPCVNTNYFWVLLVYRWKYLCIISTRHECWQFAYYACICS